MLYLSNSVEEEVRLHLQEVMSSIYTTSIVFLRDLNKKFRLKNSPDGKIHLSPNAYESTDKIVKVEEQFNRVVISFQGVPCIKENRWSNLISAVDQAVNLPNLCFKVDIVVVNEVVVRLNYNPQLVYRAILKICDPYLIEEMAYKVMQMQNIPTQEELETQSNIFLEDELHYRIMPAMPTT